MIKAVGYVCLISGENIDDDTYVIKLGQLSVVVSL
jgi:hypothetical protein